MLNLETDLIKLKMESQCVDIEKLKNENSELSSRLSQAVQEKDELFDQLRREKENGLHQEDKISKIYGENRELNHKLENARHNLRSVEEHVEFLEERREVQLDQMKQIKGFLEAEKAIIQEEKILLIKEKDRYRSLAQDVNQEKEDLAAERRIVSLENEKIRSIVDLMKIDKPRLPEDSFVMVEACSELDTILTENRVLRDNLSQLASEKSALQKEIRVLSNNLNNMKMEHDAKKKESMTCTSMPNENLVDVVKEKEKVIASLMDVVESLKKNQNSVQFIKDHERVLLELTSRLSESADKFDTMLLSTAMNNSGRCCNNFKKDNRQLSMVESLQQNNREVMESLSGEVGQESIHRQLLRLHHRIGFLEEKRCNVASNGS